MRIPAGLFLVAVIALDVNVLVARADPPPTTSSDARRTEFDHESFGGAMRAEWACFSGVVEWLDGPAREGMARQLGGSSVQGCLRGMQGDADGNLYMCDFQSGMLRAYRKRDGRLLTLSGNGHVTSGRIPEQEGPAYRLGLGAMVYIAVVGQPLEGKGSVYLMDGYYGMLLRLFRNEKQGGLWWYERVAGGGNTVVGAAREYPALEVKLGDARVFATPEGKIGVIRYWGPGGGTGCPFWLTDGKLVPAYDLAKVTELAGGNFACYGIDGKGNFVGAVGPTIVALAADGKSLRAKVKSPVDPCWGVYPDPRREWWFVKSMDQYNITRVKPDGTYGTLCLDGSWSEKTGYKGISSSVWWMWGQPTQGGQYIGWNSHGCLPVFVGTWLEKE